MRAPVWDLASTSCPDNAAGITAACTSVSVRIPMSMRFDVSTLCSFSDATDCSSGVLGDDAISLCQAGAACN